MGRHRQGIEEYVAKCGSCQLVGRPPRPTPMKRSSIPDGPWQEIAVDFLGPVHENQYLLVCINYFSRYKEIKIMSNITAESTVKHLKEIFSRLGAPKSITSDNGPQFKNSDYRKFCEINGIIPYYTPPYWPAANGLVERQNESIKKRLQISELEGTNWKDD